MAFGRFDHGDIQTWSPTQETRGGAKSGRAAANNDDIVTAYCGGS
jgi:hypothetical protein